jgi:hypothetical protein
MKKNNISAIKVLTTMANSAFNNAYSEDSDKWSATDINSDLAELYKSLEKYEFDIREMSKTELEEFGFQGWDSTGLHLIPAWVFPLIPKDLELTTIMGEKFTLNDNPNPSLDTRGGLLSFGFIPTVTEDTKFDTIEDVTFADALGYLLKNNAYVMVSRDMQRQLPVFIQIIEPKKGTDCTTAYFALTTGDGEFTSPWIPSLGDMFSTQWCVYKKEVYIEKLQKIKEAKMKSQQEAMAAMTEMMKGMTVSENTTDEKCDCNGDCKCENCNCSNDSTEIDIRTCEDGSSEIETTEE